MADRDGSSGGEMDLTMQMRQVSRRFGLSPSTWIVGGVVALAASFLWPSAYFWVWDRYDDFRPVATVEARAIDVRPDEIHFSVAVTKNRDCSLISRFALVTLPDGTVARVRAERADGAPMGTLNVGDTLRSTWRVYPLLGTRWLRVYLRYDCDGRVVTQQAFEHTLPIAAQTLP